MNKFKLKNFKFESIVEDKNQGILRVFESEKIPFSIERVFTVVNALGGSKRGQHAHKICNQLLCCVSGKIELICDNGFQKINKLLLPENEGVLIQKGIWAEQNYLEDNSVLIVFCDQPYDEDDYIRDYSKFLEWKNK